MEFSRFERVHELVSRFRSLKHLFTMIRNQETNRVDFCRYADRLMTLICEEALPLINARFVNVTTPTNCTYAGEVVDADQMVVISIMRAGDSMLSCFLSVAPEATVGKILIQRNEETAEPQLYYSKLPSLVDKDIVLLDPMLATGGSALAALKVLVDNGAERNRISFLNVVSCPEGLKRLLDAFPDLQIVTGQIDERLNEKSYIIPGLGDYGDRYFGTF